jgi:putative nucleotidyltransferase with HDIG domain
VRTIDTSFRYGGDDFAVLLPGTAVDGSLRAAERIRKGLEACIDLEGRSLTCSIGIACWPTDGVMREDIIHAVDSALYLAKNRGRNQTGLACEAALSGLEGFGTGQEEQSGDAATGAIYALAATVDARQTYTYGHSKKVSKYATDIAEAMGYPKNDMERIRVAALLHDIGKIGISDHILAKGELLTGEEWELVRTHPGLAVAILKNVADLKECLAAVQYHHEHYDGSGYPAGLRGDNIPLDARIIAVADAYDAMTSGRPYRHGKVPHEYAVAELARCSGSQFDPRITEAFIRLQRHASEGKMIEEEPDKSYQSIFLPPADGNL